VEWHFTTTNTVKGQVATPIEVDLPQSAFPAIRDNFPIEASEGAFMLDIVMLALGLGFFVAAVGYTYACERL
jgi:hypothetical protein